MQANPRLRRTVQFFGTIHLGAEPVIIGGFYSYGDTRWSQIYEWTSEFWTPVQKADRNLRFFDYNVDTEVIGEVHPPSPTLVGNGTYIIRYVDASDVVLAVSPYRGRTRVPTLSNTEPRSGDYRTRTRDRDAHTCLITGLSPFEPGRLKAAHIFPRSFDREWIKKDFSALITDIAPPASLGGHLKIDSVQNVLLLRSDLREAWDAYEIGVDVADGYKVIAFTGGNDDIHGRILRLDHIVDPTIRPLDALLKDHFEQCAFKRMCGAEEHLEDEFEFELNPFEPYSLDMSDTARWTSSQGKHLLEHVLRDRLFEHRVAQDAAQFVEPPIQDDHEGPNVHLDILFRRLSGH